MPLPQVGKVLSRPTTFAPELLPIPLYYASPYSSSAGTDSTLIKRSRNEATQNVLAALGNKTCVHHKIICILANEEGRLDRTQSTIELGNHRQRFELNQSIGLEALFETISLILVELWKQSVWKESPSQRRFRVSIHQK